jgi:hypothetical protein
VDAELDAVVTGFDLLPSSGSAITTGKATFAGVSAGAVNAYEVTMPDTRLANVDGDEVVFFADKTNTGAPTLNVDTLGAVSMVQADGNALVADDILIGIAYTVRYDGANTRFQLVGPSGSFLVAAAASAAASAASASAASTSETNAGTSETNAGVSETNALASENVAAEWAVNVVDDDVSTSPGEFSSLHWASGAEAWATQAEDSAIVTNFGGDGVTTFSAFHWAQKSAASSGLPAGATGDMLDNLAGTYQVSPAIRSTPTDGIDISGVSANNPTAGGTQDTGIHLYNASFTDVVADIEFASASILKLISRVHAGHVQLVGEDTGGAETVMLDADPDGRVSLYHNGAATSSIQTNTTGARVLGSSGSSVTLDLTSDAGGLEVRHQWNGGQYIIDNFNTSGTNRFVGRNSGASSTNMLWMDPNGSVDLYFAGLEKLATAVDGIEVHSPTAPNIQLMEGGAEAAIWQVFTDTHMYFDNRTLLGNAVFRLSEVGASDQVYMTANNAGSLDLYYDNTQVLATSATGVDVVGLGSTFSTASASAINVDIYNSEGGGRLNADGDIFSIQQTDNVGAAEDTWITMAADGAVSLYYNDVLKLSTASVGATLLGVTASVLLMDLDGSASASAASYTARNSEGGLDLGANGGGFLLQQTASSGSLEETWIAGAEDGAVSLYHNGAVKAATDAAGVVITGHFEQTSMTVAPVGTDEFYISDGGTLKSMSYNESAKPVNTDAGIHTFVDADVGTIRLYTGGTSTHAWTMNTGVGQTGCAVIVINDGTTAGPTLTAGTATLETAGPGLVVKLDGTVALINIGSDVWKVTGDLEA